MSQDAIIEIERVEPEAIGVPVNGHKEETQHEGHAQPTIACIDTTTSSSSSPSSSSYFTSTWIYSYINEAYPFLNTITSQIQNPSPQLLSTFDIFCLITTAIYTYLHNLLWAILAPIPLLVSHLAKTKLGMGLSNNMTTALNTYYKPRPKHLFTVVALAVLGICIVGLVTRQAGGITKAYVAFGMNGRGVGVGGIEVKREAYITLRKILLGTASGGLG